MSDWGTSSRDAAVSPRPVELDYLADLLRIECARTARYGQSLALAILSGYGADDAVIRSRLRRSDILVALSNQRAAVILPHTSAEQAGAVIRRLQQAPPEAGTQLRAGLAQYPNPCADAAALIETALDGSRPLPPLAIDTPPPAADHERDPLTGVRTRDALMRRLDEEAARNRRYQQPYAALLLDADHFKSINDAFGHQRGDQVLAELAQRLRHIHRACDEVFRYGGDEFVVLLPQTAREQAVAFAQRLVNTMRTTPLAGDPPLTLTLSVGVAAFPEDGDQPEEVLAAADRRHYQAKRAGRDLWVSAEQENADHDRLLAPERLVERDGANEGLARFLVTLPRADRGLLTLQGEAGSGRSRFLADATRQARLQGFCVLPVHARPALSRRLYGAISEACRAWQDLPLPEAGEAGLARGLRKLVRQSAGRGLLIMVDDAEHLDHGSLELLGRLMQRPELYPIGLVMTAHPLGGHGMLSGRIPLISTLELNPLSATGVRVWLRYALRGEPDESFADWVLRRTNGIPRRIERLLGHLQAEYRLHWHDHRWWPTPDYGSSPTAIDERVQANGNLSLDLPLLVGREGELRHLKTLFAEQRIVTLLGPGGQGKTRLAQQFALEHQADFPGGTFFISLAGLPGPEAIAAAVADALRVQLSGPDDPLHQLTGRLPEQPLLLILDNFEHLRAAAPRLKRLVQARANLFLLITSRDRLGLIDEAVLELGGLSYPAPDDPFSEHYSAVQLFLIRARQCHAGFALKATDQPAVAAICRITHGLPLGIELAAAWVRTFSCAAIARDIEHDIGLLGAAHTRTDAEEAGVYAVLSSFWCLLSDAERTALQALSVFRGGFDRQAAQAVAAASPFFLDALVAKAYLHLDEHGRYQIHELLRQFARDRRRQDEHTRHQGRRRHALYYTRLLQGLARNRHAPGDRLATIGCELDNIRAAWRWASANRELWPLARGRRGLSRAYQRLGLIREASDVLAHTIAALAADTRAGHCRLRARLMTDRADLLTQLADYPQAIQLASSAAEASAARGDIVGEAGAMLAWAQALWRPGQYPAARAILERAVELAASIGVLDMQATGLRYLGNVAGFQGDYEQEVAFYERALPLYRRLGDGSGEAMTLNAMADMLFNQGRFDANRRLLEQALSLCRRVRDDAVEGVIALNLGLTTLTLGDFDGARRHFRRALTLGRALGTRQIEGEALSYLGLLTLHQCDWALSERLLNEALTIATTIGDRQVQGHIQATLARLRLVQGHPDAGLEHVGRALDAATAMGERNLQARALTTAGWLHLERGDPDAAQDAFQTADTLRATLGQSHHQVEIEAGLMAADRRRGDCDQATPRLEHLLRLIDETDLIGAEHPFVVLVTVLDALQARNDIRLAAMRQRTLTLLQTRARSLRDPADQTRYLAEHPIRRALGAILGETPA